MDAAAPQHAERALDYLLEQAVALDYRDNKEDLGGVVRAGGDVDQSEHRLPLILFAHSVPVYPCTVAVSSSQTVCS